MTILATDLSQEVLGRAEAGRFSQLEVNRGLPAALLVKHFARDGREWQLHDDVRRMVTFRQLNLARPLSRIPADGRRVSPQRADLLRRAGQGGAPDRVSEVLRPDGYLFLGAAETTYGLDNSYERVQVGRSICYRLTTQTRVTSGRDRR